MHHPNIVQYLYSYKDKLQRMCLMTEYMDSGNLYDHIHSGVSMTFEQKADV